MSYKMLNMNMHNIFYSVYMYAHTYLMVQAYLKTSSKARAHLPPIKEDDKKFHIVHYLEKCETIDIIGLYS